MTALMAIPVMAEVPAVHDWVGIVLISLGVYAVNDGPASVRIRLRRVADPRS